MLAPTDIQEVTCFSDASFAPTAGRSRSGLVYTIGSSILDWASHANSSEPADGTWTSALRCDNSAAIILAFRESFQPLKWSYYEQVGCVIQFRILELRHPRASPQIPVANPSREGRTPRANLTHFAPRAD